MKRANLIITGLYYIGSFITISLFSAILSTTYTIEINNHLLNIGVLGGVSILVTLIFFAINPLQLKKIKDFLDNEYNDSSAGKINLLVTYPFRIIPVFVSIWLIGMAIYLFVAEYTGIIQTNFMPAGYLFSCIFAIIIGTISQLYAFKIAINGYISKAIKKLNITKLDAIYIPLQYKLIGIFSLVIVSSYFVMSYAIYNGARKYINNNLYDNTFQLIPHIDGIINNNPNADNILKNLTNEFKGEYRFYLYNAENKSIKNYSAAALNKLSEPAPALGNDIIKQLGSTDIVPDGLNNQILLSLPKTVTINNTGYRLVIGVNKSLYKTPLNNLLYSMSMSGVFILLIVLIIAFLLSTDISTHEKSLVDSFAKLSKKELTHLPPVVTTDELGLISVNIRELIMNFRQLKFRTNENITTMNTIVNSTSNSIIQAKATISQQSEYTNLLLDTINSIKHVSEQIMKAGSPLNGEISRSSENISNAIQKNNELITYIDTVSNQLSNASILLSKKINIYKDIKTGIARLKAVFASINSISDSTITNTSHLNSLLKQFSESVSAIKTFNTMDIELTKDLEALLIEAANVLDGVFALLSEFLIHIQQTDEMLGVINNVAERTNLLSVNAFILASSPQTEGRNFKVVAEEIKKLASRARMESRDITGYITKVRRNIDELFLRIKDTNSFIVFIKQSFDGIHSVAMRLDQLTASTIDALDTTKDIKGKDGRLNIANGSDIEKLIEDISVTVNSLSGINDIFSELKNTFGKLSEISNNNNTTLTTTNNSIENIKTFTGYINDTLVLEIRNQTMFFIDSANRLNSSIENNKNNINEVESIVNRLTRELNLLDENIKVFTT